ncbi:MAG: hypothetical protein ACRD43_15720, partial [Pyrinomonadaceae bacterium]
MPGTDQNLSVCGNGHQQPSNGSRFCIYCGVALAVAASAPVAEGFPTPGLPQAPQAAPTPNQNYQPPPATPYPQYQQFRPQYAPPMQAIVCRTCGGYGQGLPDRSV